MLIQKLAVSSLGSKYVKVNVAPVDSVKMPWGFEVSLYRGVDGSLYYDANEGSSEVYTVDSSEDFRAIMKEYADEYESEVV